MNRAEWGVVVSIAISAATALFTGGVIYGQVQTHETKLIKLEMSTDDMKSRIERIDANVGFLAERAREDRERMDR